MSGDIDPDLFHHRDCQRMNLPRFGPAAEYLVTVSVFCVHVPFRHLGPGGIVGADKQDLLFHDVTILSSSQRRAARVVVLIAIPFRLQPQCHVHEADEHRHFYERSDYRGKCRQ